MWRGWKALTIHASTCLQLPQQLLSTMRPLNRQTQSKWGNPLKIPLTPLVLISPFYHPIFHWFSLWLARGFCRNKLPPPPGFADVSKVRHAMRCDAVRCGTKRLLLPGPCYQHNTVRNGGERGRSLLLSPKRSFRPTDRMIEWMDEMLTVL